MVFSPAQVISTTVIMHTQDKSTGDTHALYQSGEFPLTALTAPFNGSTDAHISSPVMCITDTMTPSLKLMTGTLDLQLIGGLDAVTVI